MKSSRARTALFGSLMLGMLLLSGLAAAQLYGSNVVASKSNPVTVSSSGTATVDNTATTGVSASITGLTGGTKAVVTTTSLNAPSTGVGTFSTSGTPVYFDLSVTLPAGTTAPAGAMVTVCFTNPSIASSDVLSYWSGSGWTSATNIVVTGTQICGTVPLSALTGTNFAVAPPAAADYTLYYVLGIVVIVIVVALVVLMMRRRKT